jgi:hypothetical protein
MQREPLPIYPSNLFSRRRALLGAVFAISNLTLVGDIHAQVQQPGLRDQIPPSQAPVQPENAKPGETLSEQLDRSGGVIKPPTGVDPKIEAPAPEPNPGKMPVVPPPGSPGGDPNVQPK